MDWLFEPARLTFCEEAVSGPIRHPAEVWTNVGPLIAGMLILWRGCRPLERLLGIGALLTAVASAYYHARSNILGESLDLGGMYLFIFTVAALQQHRAYVAWEQHDLGDDAPRRRGGWRWRFGTNGQLILLVILFTALFAIGSAFSTIFASPAFALIVAAVVLREAFSPHAIGRWGWALIMTFSLAWALWWLDYTRILCEPGNHILTGHGVWHLLNGLVFWFTFLHFACWGSDDAVSLSGKRVTRQEIDLAGTCGDKGREAAS